MKKRKTPEIIQLTEKEAQELIERTEQNNLSENDREIVVGLIKLSIWLSQQLLRAKISITRLKKIFGFTTEKRKTRNSDGNSNGSDSANKASSDEVSNDSRNKSEATHNKSSNNAAADPTDNSSSPSEDMPSGDLDEKVKKKGHGRLGYNDYQGLNEEFIQHESLNPGDTCPEECGGRLYDTEDPGVCVKLTGNAPVTGTRISLQKLRCNRCGKTFTASTPGKYSEHKYDECCKATIAVLHYGMGFPFHRLETLQNMVNIPLPDATQFELVEDAANAARPVFEKFEKLAANGTIVNHDDTKGRVLALMQENIDNPDLERKGMFTTGIVSHLDEHKIYLFYTGRKHAGENLSRLLDMRDDQLDPIIQMCDGHSANKKLNTTTILCNCLAHARRKFYEIDESFPKECRIVLDIFSLIYKNEILAQGLAMDNPTRLLFHQQYSKPAVEKLQQWCNQQIDDHMVEPNSVLGEAIKYMQKRWPELTRFLTVEGAPLDNNLCERALKRFIIGRKNWFFYRTEISALIGNILISVITTCHEAGENPIKYLVAIQKNRRQVFQNPEQWLPWNYQKHLKEIASSKRPFSNPQEYRHSADYHSRVKFGVGLH